MPAYVSRIVQSVSNPAMFAEYQELGLPSLDLYGGKIVGGGSVVEIPDGDWSPGVVVAVEFESLAKTKEWYNSKEYQAVISGRFDSIVSGVVFVKGSF